MNTLESELRSVRSLPHYLDFGTESYRIMLEKWSQDNKLMCDFLTSELKPSQVVGYAAPYWKLFIPNRSNSDHRKLHEELAQIVDLNDNLENPVAMLGNPIGVGFILGLITPAFAVALSYYFGTEFDFHNVIDAGAYGAKLGGLIGTAISIGRFCELIKARQQASHIEYIIQQVNPRQDNFEW